MRAVIAARRFFFVRRSAFLLIAANPVFLGGPCAKIDLLAAFGAERTEAVLGGPADIFAAGGTFDDGRHTVGRSIANGTSNEYRAISRRFKGAVPDIRLHCEMRRWSTGWLQ